MGKRIAIVQSNYIPWKGYFDMINLCDEFVLYDCVQYTRRDWRNRNQIKTAGGPAWLTVPVEAKGKYHQLIKDTLVSDASWAANHWRTLCHTYGRCRHFREYSEPFREAYLGASRRFLSEINRTLLEAACRLLGIRTQLSWSMDYCPVGDKSERLLSICQQARATEYLSGPAARAYLDEGLFARHGVKVRWMNYSGYAEYAQHHPPFAHQVSIVDLIFHLGPEAPRFMKSFDHAAIHCFDDVPVGPLSA